MTAGFSGGFYFRDNYDFCLVGLNSFAHLRISPYQDSKASKLLCGDGVCNEKEKANLNLCPEDCEIPQQDSVQLDAFIAVHMEEVGDQQLELRWPRLSSVISEADKHGLKLTLEFNPSWANFILEDNSRLQTLRSWEANGHEIALHHHGPYYEDGWNGYTNDPNYWDDLKFKGSIEDMMEIMEQLPLNGKILTAGIGKNTQTDWPEGVIFDATGGTDSNEIGRAHV